MDGTAIAIPLAMLLVSLSLAVAAAASKVLSHVARKLSKARVRL